MRLSTTVLNVPEELGVRSRPRVPEDETEIVQLPSMETLTSVVSVPQISDGLEEMEFSQSRAVARLDSETNT